MHIMNHFQFFPLFLQRNGNSFANEGVSKIIVNSKWLKEKTPKERVVIITSNTTNNNNNEDNDDDNDDRIGSRNNNNNNNMVGCFFFFLLYTYLL